MTGTIDPLAKAVMVARCGWDPTVKVTDLEVWLNGKGTSLLTLPSLYVTDVATVEVHHRDTTVDTLTIGDDVDWGEDGELVYRRWDGVWPIGMRNVRVVYSGGYEPVPDDLNAALESLSKRTATLVPAKRRMGTASVEYAGDIAAGGLLLTETMVFDRYRIVRVA